MKRIFLILFLLSSVMLYAEDIKVSSPKRKVSVAMSLNHGLLTYSVRCGGQLVVEDSPLGLVTDCTSFYTGLSLLSQQVSSRDDMYSLPTGKCSLYHDCCNELTLNLRNADGWDFGVQCRVYEDGFAFRYLIPSHPGTSSLVVVKEESRMRVARWNYCLGAKFIGGVNDPNYPYETFYKNYNWDALQHECGDARLNTPTLVGSGSKYLLITEAANVGTYSTSLLRAEAQEGEFSFSYAGDTKDYQEDKAQRLTVELPVQTPWRCAIVGDLATIFQSTMVENLNEPTSMTDTEWIKAGRAAWDWGGQDGGNYQEYGGRYQGDICYTDLGAEMGWEYLMIDGGWNPANVAQLIRYAKSQGLESLLWQSANLNHSKEFSNENMEKTMKQWFEWGVKGIKIDFWEDDSRETMARMERLIQLAAEYKMLVNYHGCTRPSGLRRTYPHLMSYEGVLGGEQNFWSDCRIHMTTEHHINLMMTRNVVGPADFTPGDFSLHNGTLLANLSFAQRLGLCVGMENGILHFCESPANYKYFFGKDVLKRIPVAWDESRMLEAKVQQYVTIARRHAEDWWLCGASVQARTCVVKPTFLDDDKKYTAYVYRDGNCHSQILFEKIPVTSTSVLKLDELAEGGFLVQISPNAHLDCPPKVQTYEAESASNEMSQGVNVRDFNSLFASGGKQVNDLGLGRSLTFRGIKAEKTGDYVVTFYYSTIEDRKAEVLLNGKSQGLVTFQGNSNSFNTYDSDGLGWYKMVVPLQAGENNVLTIQSEKEGWAPNFDRITVQPL